MASESHQNVEGHLGALVNEGTQYHDSFPSSDPLSSLKNSIYLSLSLSNLPEFHGLPNEDIDDFLKKFSRATTALPYDQKCLALKKALVGDASIYLKTYLKGELLRGDWKSVKDSLRKRFSQVEPNLMYRTELNKMTFDQKKSTLLGYVDRYANLYRKIHSEAKDDELIQDISLNLGKKIILKLNQLSSDWKSLNNFEIFRSLISRLERDILSLEGDTMSETTLELANTVNQLVTSALQTPIKGIQDILGQLSKKAKSEPEIENVAAVKYGGYPDRSDDRPRQGYGKRKDRQWDSDKDHQNMKEDDEQVEWSLVRRGKELRQAYEDKFGPLYGPCFLCGGHHFRRHCPLAPNNLKELRSLR